MSETLRRPVVATIRPLLVFAAIVALLIGSLAPAFAAGGQTGNLQGVIVNGTTGQPVVGAKVTAVAPAATATVVTDAKGFFSLLGLTVDTYTVTVEAPGFDALTLPGTTVPGDENLNLGRLSLIKTARTIARVNARSVVGAYQPGQTTDSYTVSGNRVIESTGKTNTIDQNQIILSVPGVTLTNSGIPTIRGGSPTEVGFQLDGIPFSEPFLYGSGSFNRVNGLGSIQVVEGAGDATQGDIASGAINVIPKRGSYPGTGTIDAEIGGPNFSHQLAADYGTATKSGNVSEYLSYTGNRFDPYYGYHTTNVQDYGNGLGTSYRVENQLLNNFVVKFGKNKSQSLQVLYSNQNIESFGNVGGLVTDPTQTGYLSPYNTNPLSGNEFVNPPGPNAIPNYSSIAALLPYTANPGTPITSAEQSRAANTRFLKFEYDSNIGANTFLALRAFNWSQLDTTQANENVTANGLANYQTVGGNRNGAILDISRQVGSKLTLQLNGSYQLLHPIWNLYQPQLTFFGDGFGDATSPGVNYGDFEPGGYLSQNAQYLPGGVVPRIPSWGINYNGAFFQEYGVGIRAQYAPTSRLKFDIGARNEQQYQHWFNPYNTSPNASSNPFDVLPQSFNDTTLDPHVFQPRLAASYQAGPNDSFKVGYGRSAIFVNAQTAGTPFGPTGAAALLNVPAKPGAVCGLANFGGTFPCANYAQQLYWNGDAVEAPDAGGSRPAIYSNYDFTYQHLFKNGFGLHLTPFYKLGVDLPAASLIATLAGGQQIFGITDAGFNRTTGVEAELTTREVPVGFSGFVSATYQNVLQSAPPLSNGEDSEPQLSVATLALGNVYRAGYVSPFTIRAGGTYNFKNGLRVTPVIQYDRGFPFNVGDLIAAQLPDGSFANVKQVNFGAGVTPLVGYQNSQGTEISTNYFDPSNPGTTQSPNIAATRGTPSTPSNGGALFKPNVQANLTVEYHLGRNVLGAQATNLFGNAFNGTIPLVNPYYQPVANGLSGPLTGVNPLTPTYGTQRAGGNIPHDSYAYTNGAYLLSNGVGQQLAPLNPTVFTLYYQYKL